MVDIFSLAVTHALIAIALWRLVQRADLDPPRPRIIDRIGGGRPLHGEEDGQGA